MAEKLLTVQETAGYLDIHPITLYKWLKKNKIPATKLGKNWRFKKAKLEAWIDKNTKGK